MNRTRRYLPLITFVVPNVIVAYAIVIPRSCIAGVNELSVGFALTIVGACFTYVAGQRAVIADASGRLSSWTRLMRRLNRQAASPSGAIGRMLAAMWRFEHARVNSDVLDALEIREGHRVLEVGCGAGHALHEATRRARGGFTLGIDVSALMVHVASRRLRDAIGRRQAQVLRADAAAVALEPRSFDRIFAVHAIYFWPDLEAALAKLADALRNDGKLVLAFRPDSDLVPLRFREATYHFPRLEQVRACLEHAGLVVSRVDLRGKGAEVIVVSEREPRAKSLYGDGAASSSGVAASGGGNHSSTRLR